MEWTVPVLYHTGPSGNQSPRHITQVKHFRGSRRGSAICSGVPLPRQSIRLPFTGDVALGCSRKLIDLPARSFPSVDEAQEQLDRAAERLEMLRRSGADRRQVRTAECDWFGAEETLTLARAAANGRLREVIASVMPAEISLMRIGPWAFAGWPGEAFVEFSLRVKSSCTRIVT